MDVTVKVYLSGGQTWEFVCDEGDPMAVGLVTALPGANAETELSADGLIQVETRSGERMYLTRSSLVAVSILGRDPVIPAHRASAKTQFAMSLPSPFVVLPGCFTPEDETLLVAAASAATIKPPVNAVAEIEFGALPKAITERLLTVIAEGRQILDLADDEAELDLSFYVAGAEGAIDIANAVDAADILTVAVAIPVGGGDTACEIDIFDQDTVTPTGATTGPSRRVTLKSGAALVVPNGVKCGALKPLIHGAGEVLVAVGRLRKV